MAKKNQLTTSDYLAVPEMKRLLKGLHDDGQYMWELYVRLAFCTALRVSDVLSLTWADVLHRESLVKTEKKTGKTRRIPFNPSTQDRIFELYHLMKKPNPNECIFISARTRQPITVQYLNRLMKEWKKKYRLDIGNFSTHSFRKSFGRYVYDTHKNKSEALVLINNILNHSSIEVTKVYIGLRAEEIRSVFSSISI
jgi:integrase